jgi:hypothetical protein
MIFVTDQAMEFGFLWNLERIALRRRLSDKIFTVAMSLFVASIPVLDLAADAKEIATRTNVYASPSESA